MQIGNGGTSVEFERALIVGTHVGVCLDETVAQTAGIDPTHGRAATVGDDCDIDDPAAGGNGRPIVSGEPAQ